MTMKFIVRVVSKSIVAQKKFEEKKTTNFEENALFVRTTLKRWQTSTNSKNYNLYMFSLLEIARIYKALKLFADLQGPICYNNPQNKGISLIVY